VAKLENAGWVQRRDCPGDKRGQLADLTDDGFKALEEAAPGHVEDVRTYLFDRLTPTQVKQLRSISDAMVAGLVQK
jgi:DNA-binding MarR family transcriptional regulator